MKRKIILQRIKELLKGNLQKGKNKEDNHFVNEALNIIEEKIGKENEKRLHNYIKKQTIDNMEVINKIIAESYREVNKFIEDEFHINDCDVLDLKNNVCGGNFTEGLKGIIFLKDDNFYFDGLSFEPEVYCKDKEKNIKLARKYNLSLQFFIDSVKKNCKTFIKQIKKSIITFEDIEEYFKKRGEIFTEIAHSGKENKKYRFGFIKFIETNKNKYENKILEKILFEIICIRFEMNEGVIE